MRNNFLIFLLFIMPAVVFAGAFDNYRDSNIYCGSVVAGAVAYNDENGKLAMGQFTQNEVVFVCKQHKEYFLVADTKGPACDVLEVSALAWVEKTKITQKKLFECVPSTGKEI